MFSRGLSRVLNDYLSWSHAVTEAEIEKNLIPELSLISVAEAVFEAIKLEVVIPRRKHTKLAD